MKEWHLPLLSVWANVGKYLDHNLDQFGWVFCARVMVL